MTRINTNVPSLIAQRVLRQNNLELNTSLERLSTGLRVNRGKDDPAGLIASENLRKEITGIEAAIGNAERADQVVNIAEGGLQEISTLLTELQGLLTQTANDAAFSREEKEANQLQVDSILQTIDRLASSTNFQGGKLLNGALDYNTTGVSGVISTFQVRGAKLEHNGTRDVDVLVTASAHLAAFVLSLGGTSIDLNAGDGSQESFTLEIEGNLGAREVTFSSGTTIANIITTINTFTDVTGVRATASGPSAVRISSTEYGSDQFVSVKVVDDGQIQGGANIGIYTVSAGDTDLVGQAAGAQTLFTTVAAQNGLTDEGQDVQATVNGISAVTNGTRVAINTDFLDVELDLQYDTANPSAANVGLINAFTIEGGGADFQLDGEVSIAGKVSIGIQNVNTRSLGERLLDTVGGGGGQTFYNLADLASGRPLNFIDGDLSTAQKILDEAVRDLSSLRGRLGAFQQNVIGATIRSLGVAMENTSSAESVIRDTDFASETAKLTRAQILSQASNQSLLQANTAPQSALQLLG